MSAYPTLFLKPGKEASVKRKHPWIFSGAINRVEGNPSEGDLVRVFSNTNEYLATGHYQKSSIAVRIMSFTDREINRNFWMEYLNAAFEKRKSLPHINTGDTNVFRLVNGEGDNLPGLVIDHYNGHLVIQMHSAGMYMAKEDIREVLMELFQGKIKSIFDKSSGTLPFKSGIELKDEYLFGKAEDINVNEYSNIFSIEPSTGQKTGFFIDQRENRRLLAEYSSGRSVLNMFSYSGGFSVYALKGNAAKVHSVDSSVRAIELAEKNVELNFGKTDRHKSFTTDVYSYFEETRDKYDLIILDPPAFAKHQKVLKNALQGYKKLNRKAITMIEPGGIIFTFSCSQAVSREDFKRSVFTAAAYTGRKVSILYQLSQPPDHPVSLYHPEGEYLKGLVLLVD